MHSYFVFFYIWLLSVSMVTHLYCTWSSSQIVFHCINIPQIVVRGIWAVSSFWHLMNTAAVNIHILMSFGSHRSAFLVWVYVGPVTWICSVLVDTASFPIWPFQFVFLSGGKESAITPHSCQYLVCPLNFGYSDVCIEVFHYGFNL